MTLAPTQGLLGSITSSILSLKFLLIALVLCIVYKIVLEPLAAMRFYKKQGLSSYYFPFLGMFKRWKEGCPKYGDAFYNSKIQARKNPNRAFVTNLGSSANVVLHNTAMIKEHFLHPENYIKDPKFVAIFWPLFGKGIITSEDELWKRQRRILSNSFHFEFVKSKLPTMQKTAHDIIAEVKTYSLENVDIMNIFQRITGEIIGRLFFSEQVNDHKVDGVPMTLTLINLMNELGLIGLSLEHHILGPWFIHKGILPKHRRLMQRIARYKGVCNDIIEARKKQHEVKKPSQDEKDMLDLLLEYTSEGKLSSNEIIDQFITFSHAGMDTAGHLITMSVYYLHMYPEYRAKVMEEVTKHYSPDRVPTIEELNKLEFTLAFLKETLRVMTPVPALFPRKAVRDHQLQDLKIRKGDTVMLDFFYTHFDPKHFDDVEVFNPNRWLDKDKQVDAYAFTPFSAGPRNCMGQHVALIESRIILAEFLTMYDFKMKGAEELKMEFRFLYEPLKPLVVDITPKC